MAYTIDDAIAHIRTLTSLRQLNEEDFCKEGGLADGPMADFIDRREPLKPTQLRKIFNELTSLEKVEFSRARLVKVMPKLAYASGRDLIPNEFYLLMSECISRINDKEDFKKFMEYIRAMMAYHKYESRYRFRKGGRI